MPSAFDVAAFIERELGPQPRTKLQKLAYYAQAWSLVWDGRPLFPQVIKAWTLGPVSPELWHGYPGRNQGNPGALTPEDAATVRAVLDAYGHLTADELIKLSHSEVPWRAARQGLAPHERGAVAISHEAMRAYYAQAVEPGRKQVPDAVRSGVRFLLSIPEDELESLTADSDVPLDAALDWIERGGDPPWDES